MMCKMCFEVEQGRCACTNGKRGRSESIEIWLLWKMAAALGQAQGALSSHGDNLDFSTNVRPSFSKLWFEYIFYSYVGQGGILSVCLYVHFSVRQHFFPLWILDNAIMGSIFEVRYWWVFIISNIIFLRSQDRACLLLGLSKYLRTKKTSQCTKKDVLFSPGTSWLYPKVLWSPPPRSLWSEWKRILDPRVGGADTGKQP